MSGQTRPITRAITRAVTRPLISTAEASALAFSWPAADLGAGAVDLTLSRGTGAATFTRATTAWAKLSTGLWAQVNAGVARAHYLGADTTVGAYGGYLAEAARTNECLQARDFSNASWVKTTMTAAKDQIGIDGAANSASSLLATGAGATVKQAITSASAARRFSVFMKRLVGTGNVDITLDNGTTWTTISGSINGATFTRVAAGQTVTNPTVGIRIVTSGDKVAVDMAQEEVGGFDTTPIPTTTAAATRNADMLTYPAGSGVGGPATSLYYEGAPHAVATGAFQVPVQIDDGSGANRFIMAMENASAAPYWQVIVGNVEQAKISLAVATAGAVMRIGGRAAANNFQASKNGTLGTADTAGAMPPGVTTIRFSDDSGSTSRYSGTVKNVKVYSRLLTDLELAAL